MCPFSNIAKSSKSLHPTLNLPTPHYTPPLIGPEVTSLEFPSPGAPIDRVHLGFTPGFPGLPLVTVI